jgi:hypothetical protein
MAQISELATSQTWDDQLPISQQSFSFTKMDILEDFKHFPQNVVWTNSPLKVWAITFETPAQKVGEMTRFTLNFSFQ